MLHCVAVRCGVLQRHIEPSEACVAVCCSVAVRCSVLRSVTTSYRAIQSMCACMCAYVRACVHGSVCVCACVHVCVCVHVRTARFKTVLGTEAAACSML